MLNFFTSNRDDINGSEEKRKFRSIIPAGVFIPGKPRFPFSVFGYKESQHDAEHFPHKNNQENSKHAGKC